MIGPDASAFGFARSPSSSRSATSSTFSSSSSRPSCCFAETAANCVVAAPVLGLEALGGELRLDLVRIRVRQVDLVDRDDDRHLGRPRVGDGLLRLRHHAVVGCDDEDGDVGDLRAAGAHGGERLVARRVEEGDLPAVVVDLVGADVLGDAARLGRDDRALADRVEQRGLAVVDVAHDRHDRRPRLEILLGVLVGLRVDLLVGGVADDDLAARLGGEQLDGLVGEGLRDGDHLPQAHHELDDLRDRQPDRSGEILDVDARGDRDRTGRRRDRRAIALRRAAVAAVVALTGRAGAAAVRRVVDHDAALAAARPDAARADRTVRSIRSFVRHIPQSV